MGQSRQHAGVSSTWHRAAEPHIARRITVSSPYLEDSAKSFPCDQKLEQDCQYNQRVYVEQIQAGKSRLGNSFIIVASHTTLAPFMSSFRVRLRAQYGTSETVFSPQDHPGSGSHPSYRPPQSRPAALYACGNIARCARPKGAQRLRRRPRWRWCGTGHCLRCAGAGWRVRRRRRTCRALALAH